MYSKLCGFTVRVAEKILLHMEGNGIKKDLIPSVGFANISVQGWIFALMN